MPQVGSVYVSVHFVKWLPMEKQRIFLFFSRAHRSRDRQTLTKRETATRDIVFGEFQ